MCTVSDKLKLCTCETENVEKLKHYWILKRPTEKKHFMVGEILPPANIDENAYELNQKNILAQLNNGNCFDIELQHQENDILELHFAFKTGLKRLRNRFSGFEDYLVYAFKFKKGKWKEDYYDSFDVDFDEIQKGKIINP
jgi:hypothetical protein